MHKHTAAHRARIFSLSASQKRNFILINGHENALDNRTNRDARQTYIFIKNNNKQNCAGLCNKNQIKALGIHDKFSLFTRPTLASYIFSQSRV